MDPQNYQPSFVQDVVFNDFENFSSMIKAWGIDFQQLDRGPFSAELRQANIGSALFTQVKLNRLMHQRGNSPENHFTFAFPSEPLLLNWRKRTNLDHNIMLYEPGSEIDGVSQPGFQVFTYSLSETHIAEVLHSLELPEPHQVLGNNDMIACSRQVWERLNQTFHRLDQMLFSNPSSPYSSHIYEQLEYELQRLLITTFTSTQPLKHRSNSIKNKRTINRIMEYIEVNKREPLTVRDLCGIAGVTERALGYSFARYFGVSPSTYLKSLRLNHVHRELRKADPAETRITDVANSYGFWHMGKFAADYRSLFGELPSETLRK